MRNTRMATHSITSFDESEEIRILSGFLESKRRIKTFFKENDRTPNHDGNFELINDDKTPQKQFIVQIKKVENLQPNVQGENKGRYVYSLDTAFLYYIKEKVTESPAIYFVVDIVTKNIFWLYLSDELLMSLDFEKSGQYHSYAFTEADKVKDIDSFTETLKKISQDRNSLFIEKTPKEIAEMQDAVEYLNTYMNNDFVKIKETMFPNFWRFGLRHSISSECSITIGEKTLKPKNTAMFELYPQIKGGKDTGIQSFQRENGNGFFTTLDFEGQKKPLEYSKETLEKIIKDFFEKEYAFIYFPTIAIAEKLNVFANQLNQIFTVKDINGKVEIKKLSNGLLWLLAYIEYVILRSPQTKEEKEYNKFLSDFGRRGGKVSCDFILWCINFGCKNSFKEFCQRNDTKKIPRFTPQLFGLTKTEHIRAYFMALELEKRNVTHIDSVWEYNFCDVLSLNEELFAKKIDEICEKWLSILPNLYNETFDKLLEKNKYKFRGHFEYKNEYFKEGNFGTYLTNVIHKYNDDNFSIVHKDSITSEFLEEYRIQGVQSIHSGLIFERMLQRKTPYYDSLSCLLYKGICIGLGINPERLHLNNDGIDFL